jgi:hypothetical protein
MLCTAAYLPYVHTHSALTTHTVPLTCCQALGHNETLQELCLSWHKQQQQRAVWVSSELARQR